MRLSHAIGLALSAAIVLAGCAAGGADPLVEYRRVWADGYAEETILYPDGRVQMRHGERLERLTIPTGDVERISAALEAPIETGATGSPDRTITLADGTVIEDPRPVPEGAVDLLDRLTSWHSLDVDLPLAPPNGEPEADA